MGGRITLRKGALCVKSKKLKLNTLSSCESELVGAGEYLKQLTWAYYFLRAQGFAMTPSVLYQNNQSTIKLINNGRRSSSNKTKHIDSRFFIHDKVKSGEIEVRYCDTERMLADGFTKPLQGKKFVYFRNETLNMNVEF